MTKTLADIKLSAHQKGELHRFAEFMLDIYHIAQHNPTAVGCEQLVEMASTQGLCYAWQAWNRARYKPNTKEFGEMYLTMYTVLLGVCGTCRSPFNNGFDHFNAEVESRSVHTNPRRIEFLKKLYELPNG